MVSSGGEEGLAPHGGELVQALRHQRADDLLGGEAGGQPQVLAADLGDGGVQSGAGAVETRQQVVDLAHHPPRRPLVEPHGVEHGADALRQAQHLPQLLGGPAEDDLGVGGQSVVDILAQSGEARAHRLQMAQRVEADFEGVADPLDRGQQLALAQPVVEERQHVADPAAGVGEGVPGRRLELQPAALPQRPQGRRARRLGQPVEALVEVLGGEGGPAALHQRLHHRRAHEELARRAADESMQEGVDRLELAHRGERLDLIGHQPAGPLGEPVPTAVAGRVFGKLAIRRVGKRCPIVHAGHNYTGIRDGAGQPPHRGPIFIGTSRSRHPAPNRVQAFQYKSLVKRPWGGKPATGHAGKRLVPRPLSIPGIAFSLPEPINRRHGSHLFSPELSPPRVRLPESSSAALRQRQDL